MFNNTSHQSKWVSHFLSSEGLKFMKTIPRSGDKDAEELELLHMVDINIKLFNTLFKQLSSCLYSHTGITQEFYSWVFIQKQQKISP